MPPRYGLDGPGSESRWWNRIFIFSKTSRPSLGLTQTPVQLAPEFFPWSNAAEAGCWPLACISVEVKSKWSYTSALPVCFHGVDRDNFNCYSFKPEVHLNNKPYLRIHFIPHRKHTKSSIQNPSQCCLEKQSLYFATHYVRRCSPCDWAIPTFRVSYTNTCFTIFCDVIPRLLMRSQ